MFACTGRRTSIVSALERLTGEEARRINADLAEPAASFQVPDGTHRYVLAAGVLHSKACAKLEAADVLASLCVNLGNVVRLCELILERDRHARVCVIGSVSGFAGSFDRLYAATKAGVHAYVTTRPTTILQQLVCVAPPIIRDSGMTERRHDYPGCLQWRPHTNAETVARVVHGLLWAPRHTTASGIVYPVPPYTLGANE